MANALTESARECERQAARLAWMEPTAAEAVKALRDLAARNRDLAEEVE